MTGDGRQPAPELRVDPLTGLKVVLAPARALRPNQFGLEPAVAGGAEHCPFCEGREDRTPPEVWADRPSGGAPDGPGWRVRAVPNLYPALAPPGGGPAAGDGPVDPLHPSTGRGDPDPFSAAPAEGGHEVIVHGPRHATTLADLDAGAFDAAMAGWRERMAANAGAPCVHLIVNEGPRAGASLEHTHAQLYALPFVPAAIARERERFGAHFTRTQGGCLMCDLLAEEVRRGERVVAVTGDAVLLAPYASILPFQLSLVPRRHAPQFAPDAGVGNGLLRQALRLLREALGGAPPLNLWVRTAPRGAEHFHWRIDIVPRLAIQAGLELGTGIALNTYPPERVAADLAAAGS